MPRRILLLLFIFSALGAKAQLRHMFDTIRYDLKHKGSFFVSLDGKNSIIRDLPVKLFGLQAGLFYNQRTNLYAGYYVSYNDSRVYANPTAGSGKTDSNTVNQKYRLEYLSIGCEYYFHDSRKWRFTIPFSIGLGAGRDMRYHPVGGKILKDDRLAVAPLELGITAKYKLFWWLWAGAGIGTRLSLASTAYNGPYYSVGLSLRTGEIWRRLGNWYNRSDAYYSH